MPHKITAEWNILNAYVQGDLYNVKLNNLYLEQDVLRNAPANIPIEHQLPITINAAKYLPSASIDKLFVNSYSLINNVNMDHWIRNTVFQYENFTIMGETTIDILNAINDVKVMGNVNNISFNENNLLLANIPQTIKGNVMLGNSLTQRSRILPLNIENLQTNSVNNAPLDVFLKNKANSLIPNANIASHLVFTQPLMVSEVHSNEALLMASRDNTPRSSVEEVSLQVWQQLEDSVKKLKSKLACKIFNQFIFDILNMIKTIVFTAPNHVLHHFEIIQTLPLKAKLINHMELLQNDSLMDVITVLNHQNKMQYFHWNKTIDKFEPNPSKYNSIFCNFLIF